MNAQQVVVGIYRALEKAGCRNLVERTRKAARAAGVEFSNKQASLWLKKFVGTENGRDSGQDGDGDLSTFGTENGRGRGRESDSRVNKVSLVSNTECATAHSRLTPLFGGTDVPLDAGTHVPPERRRTPRQSTLGFDKAETILAADMCRTLWTLIESDMRGFTFAGWKKRNMVAARELARKGLTLETFRDEVDDFERERGEYPMWFSGLQKFMSRSIRESDNPSDFLPTATEILRARAAAQA